MKQSNIRTCAAALGLALLMQFKVCAQHGHLNVGAVGTNQNDALIWANGADFAHTTGYVKTLDYTNAARFAGYYQGNITLTVLPATAAHAGPDPQAPALGSYVQFSMACLEGPAGGAFNFWESTGSTPALSLAPGETSARLWRLTEADGSPGTDPYGHIHGRRFSATKPGIYKIGFTAFDTSTNGAGGGPIHRPSPQLAIWFQAGVSIVSVEPDEEEGHVHVRFGAPAGYSWRLESKTAFGPDTDWVPLGNPVVANDLFVEVIDNRPPGGQRFYRVVGAVLPP
jgi:hypothetical protein